MSFKYRDYQEEAIEKGLEVLRDLKGRREILCLPTAAGKSLIIAGIAKQLTDGKVLVFQPNTELLSQNLSKAEAFNIPISVYSASMDRKELSENLIYATPKSVTYEILKNENIKYCMLDECDFSTKDGSHMVKLLNKLKIKSVVGLTASPIYLENNLDGSIVKIMTQVKGAFFKNIAHCVQISDMVSQGYWSDFKYYDVYDNKGDDILQLNVSGSEFTEESQDKFFEEMALADKVKGFLSRMPENENALVFVPSTEVAEYLGSILEGSVVIHSKVDKKVRKERIEGFKSGKYKICINNLILTTGFDFEGLTMVVDCTPTNSLRVSLQKVGRLVRKFEGKVGKYVDFAGNYRRFGDVRDIKLEYVENYGFGLFSGQKLLTDVSAGEKEITTKEYLRQHGKPKTTQFEFTKEYDGLVKLPIGKFKGQTLKHLYFRKRWYLKYLYDSGFKHPDKKIEETLNLMFK